MRAVGVDAVLVTSVGGAFEVLAHSTVAEQLPGVPRFSLASFANQPMSWSLAEPGALAGVVALAAVNPVNPRTQELTARLRAERGADYQLTAYDAQAWDAVQLVKLAIERAGGPDDPGRLNEALQTLTGYRPSFGQPDFTLSYSPGKHLGADGLCGLSLMEFGTDNRPSTPWPAYQPPCAAPS
jgi:branched-chain amino acid transport system substrate-binding protein